MTVLSNARSMRYEVGTNLKGHRIPAAWALLLPSLEIEAAAVVGRATAGDAETLERLAGRPPGHGLTDGRGALDLVLVGRGGSELLRTDAAARTLATRLSPRGAIYGEGRGGQRGFRTWWRGRSRRLDLWPAFGPARVFVPSDDPETAAQLAALGFLPPRGSTSLPRRVLNRVAGIGPARSRARRWAELAVGPDAGRDGPPAYVVEIARSAGMDIEDAAWAVVAPGDYPSQKVLLLLFDPVGRMPRTIVKLSIDPAHAPRLANEAHALRRLSILGLAPGTVPTLRFAGEHAGRGIVGQSWIVGRPFMFASDASAESPQMAAAAAWLTSLATASIERRPASDIGFALRDLFDRFRSIHHLPDHESAFLDDQVRAVEGHAGSLPVVFQHGDPGSWNLLVDEGGQVAFLDWESAEVHGMPLWDVFHFQASFGAWVAQRHGERRRLTATMRHLVAATSLQSRFTDQIADQARQVDLPESMIEPLFYLCWMHRSLKEATRRTSATLDRGLYLRLLRELIKRRDEPALARMLAR